MHSGKDVIFGAVFEIQQEVEAAVIDMRLLGGRLFDPSGVAHDRPQLQSCGVGVIGSEVTEVPGDRLAESGSYRCIVPPSEAEVREHADADDIVCFEK